MIAEAEPLLAVEGVSKTFTTREGGSWFRRRTGLRHAVNGVSFTLRPGEVLGIVGESGSGKTTVARMIVRLIAPTSGKVVFAGRDVGAMTDDEVRATLRPAVRMIFQDPDSALNPGYTIGFGLARALTLHAAGKAIDVDSTVATLLERVGLAPSFAEKYPDELSGGEKRRVGICRALATDPRLIVADEPLSGLDVVLQERVLELLKREQEQRGFALILVSHDLDRVNQVCDRVLVMHGGRVVEHATLRRGAAPIREQYRHPYSILLQQARIDVGGFDGNSNGVDDHLFAGDRRQRDSGCSFARSCGRRHTMGDPAQCWESVPALETIGAGQSVACHFKDERN